MMNGKNKPRLTREQVRQIDRRAMEEYGMPGVILMENAGRGAAEHALSMLGDRENALVWILCGKGNNGGDGFVIARHLHNRGVRVQIGLAARSAECSEGKGDAAVNLRIALRMGLPVREILSLEDAAAMRPLLAEADLIVDALFGTGLAGDVREPARDLINVINASGRPVLAVDAPSGLCCNTGSVLGAAVKAAKTVTFAAAKVGFFAGEGPDHVGDLAVVDIGVPRELLAPKKT